MASSSSTADPGLVAARVESLRRRFGYLAFGTTVRVLLYVAIFGGAFLAPDVGGGILQDELRLTLLELGVALGQFATLLVFFAGAENVVRAMRPRAVARGADGDVVASFFIPFVNFYKPPQLISALLNDLAVESGGFRGPDGLVVGFWIVWILHAIVSRFVDEGGVATTYVMLGLLFVLLVLELVLARSFVDLARKAAEHRAPASVATVFE